MADRTTFFIIDRSIFDNWLWNEKPYDVLHAWIYLIGKANFADKKKLYKGTLQEVKRGQIVTSYRRLSEDWGWSRNKVIHYLGLLQADGMITVKGTTKGTTITIENYGKFQDCVTTKGIAESTTKGIAEGTAEGLHNNKENKVNKVNHISRRPSVEEIGGYASSIGADVDPQEFYDYYAAADWTAGGRPINDWKALLRSWGSKPRTHTSGDIMAAMFASGWGKTNDN